jgi:hypothetical protein
MSASYNQFKEVARFRAALAASKKAWQSGADREPVKSAINDFEKKLDAIDKGTRTAPGFGPINRDLTRLIAALDSADVRPSEAVRTAAWGRVVALDEAEKRWRAFRDKDLPEFNAMLRAHELKELTAPK